MHQAEYITRAENALNAYEAIQQTERDVRESLSTTIVDFLADLHHFAASKDVDLADCWRIAENHYHAEIEEAA